MNYLPSIEFGRREAADTHTHTGIDSHLENLEKKNWPGEGP